MIFWKDFVFKFLDQNGPKMRLQIFVEKSVYGTFLIFCMKLLLQQVDALNFCNILFEVTGADNIC